MGLFTTLKSLFTELNFLALTLYLCVATQGIASSYKQGAVNTIERRYYLNSRETGVIFGIYEGVFLVMLFVVSFYLDRAGNRLMVVATGVLVLAIGLFIFSLPHYFVFNQDISVFFHIQEKQEGVLCSNDTSSTSANRSSSQNTEWLTSFVWKCFLPGNILMAMGATPLYTTGVALLGHNGGQQSLYEPIFYCVAMLAPAIGLVMNSKFLQLFINHGTERPSWLTITYEDPQWLGAWWIGFLINSMIALFLACVLFISASCFRAVRLRPVLKKSATLEKRLSELSRTIDTKHCAWSIQRLLHRVKLDEAFHAVTSLLKNSYFTFMSLYATSEFASNGTIANNLIKFLEIQFAQPSPKVSMHVGITGLTAALLGLGVGCVLNKRIGKHRLAIIKMGLFTASIHLILMFVFAWPCSDSSQYVGVHLDYDEKFSVRDYAGLNASCNAGCGCKHYQKHFAPVCASKQSGDTVTFFSACFAGCKVKKNNTYEQCSCLQNTTFDNATVVYREGSSCVQACSHLPFVYFMIFIVCFLSIATAIPNIASVLASFPEQYKPVACSLQWLSLRLFGSIISSLIYAELIKNACIFHVDASPNSACLLYDHTKFGWAMAGPSVVYKALSIVFILCALVCELRRVKVEMRRSVNLAPAHISANGKSVTLCDPYRPEEHSLINGTALGANDAKTEHQEARLNAPVSPSGALHVCADDETSA